MGARPMKGTPMPETTADASYVHEESYFLGLEIGLSTAMCCKDDAQMEECLEKIKNRDKPNEHRPVDGEAEWQSWMIEMELLSWEHANV